MISINFEFDSEHGVYRDAIVLPDNHTMTEIEIENIKQKRFNNWLNAITSQEGEE